MKHLSISDSHIKTLFDRLGFLEYQLLLTIQCQIYIYIYIKYIGFGLVGFYGISTIVGYLMPNPHYTYILNKYDLVWFWFYGISTIVSYLMPNPLYTHILVIYDFVWFGFMAYQPLLVI